MIEKTLICFSNIRSFDVVGDRQQKLDYLVKPAVVVISSAAIYDLFLCLARLENARIDSKMTN